MASATQIEQILAAHKQSLEAGHGKKRAIYLACAERLGMSISSFYIELKKLVDKPARKRRNDAGKVTLSRDEAAILSVHLMSRFRANKKKLDSMENALRVLRANDKLVAGRVEESTGEFRPLSPSACHNALREYGLHPDQLNRPTPSQPQRSAHPNDVWQIDASISTLFYVPEGGLHDMHPGEFYKNKPGNFEKIKKQRLTRYVITDHTSGAICTWYVAGGESIANLAESFLEAMREKPSEALYGVPFYLYFDPGSAATKTFKRFLAALNIEPVVHGVRNARATGQVEKSNDIVEVQFESGFKSVKVPSIDWINEKSKLWCRWYNATKVHRRTKMTRLSKWMEITESELRLVDIDLARELLTREPKPAKVNDSLRINFKSKQYSVSDVPNVRLGETLNVTVNPLSPDLAWVVLYSEEGHEILHPIPQILVDQHGFEVDAPLIGREFKAPADTQIDKNRKEIQRLTYGVKTDEEAVAAAKAKALPFGGTIDPYKHLTDLPNVAILPRKGTDLGITTTTTERTYTHAEAAMQIKAAVSNWQPRYYQHLAQKYPSGVPEAAIAVLIEQWNKPATVTKIGGK